MPSADTPLKAEEAPAVYNMHDAKSNLSRLVDMAAAGREVVIAKAGTPAARLVPLAAATGAKRHLGLAAGQFAVPEDFDEPLPAETWGDLLPTA